jgi:DNA-binding transcriptional ArsR family regulator
LRAAANAADLQSFKAAFFKALAHPVRIRILELLVRTDCRVQELQEALGLQQPVVSQQLSVLRTSQIVLGRKDGNSVRYTVRDPLVADLLVIARRIFNNQLSGAQELLRELRDEHEGRPPDPRGSGRRRLPGERPPTRRG